MKITVNGEELEVEAGLTVAQLVAQHNYEPQHVAVEVNEDLVTRTKHEATALKEGDQVEIVTMVGGG
ncbi:MAG: sulfur carrier protein ThiS [Planctomycetota bacterium]|nr:MAG: sulfur carrier protein ThiS [Planctomycetota bacterium]